MIDRWNEARRAPVVRRSRARSGADSPRQFEQLETRSLLAADLVISEFMASNANSLADAKGDHPDWIELHNLGSSSINLSGWYLTDNANKPDKWALPAQSLDPGAFRIVFASGKNSVGAELHASFKLGAGSGGYLGLAHNEPGPGGLTPTIVQSFSNYPQQLVDISYGSPTGSQTIPLVSTGASAQVFLPNDDTLATNWTATNFSTGAGWTNATTGIGYEHDATGGPLEVFADTVADWSDSGAQGQNNWQYGYYDKTNDADHIYQTANFKPFPRDNGPWSATNYWTGSGWNWYAGDPPWTEIDREFIHPNGANNGPEHWSIRRWTSEISGTVEVTFQLLKQNPNGDGVTGRLFLNGQQVFTQSIIGTDTVGFTQTISIPNVAIGDAIDFAVLPEGPAGDPNDGSDGSYTFATIRGTANLASSIVTDIGAAMAGAHSTALVRIPFTVGGDLASYDNLKLGMQYDSGFVAYLNGVEVASAGAPDINSRHFNSVGVSERPDSLALAFQDFDISSRLGLLTPGPNMLAIYALNSSAADADFLILPQLSATIHTVDTAVREYFVLPTPGAENSVGTTNLGPIVSNVTHAPDQPQDNQDLVIAALVQRSTQNIAGVSLHYRVMFGAEITIPMVDDGTGGDLYPGDSLFTAIIPAAASSPGQMVRWYVTATDVSATTMRWPQFQDPLDSEQYFGTVVANPGVSSQLPIFERFLENPGAADGGGTRGAVYYLGEFYDNVRFDVHGQSTAGFPKKSYDIDFNKDHRFLHAPGAERVKDINLLSNFADKTKERNTLAYEVFKNAGAPYHYAFAVRMQQNGQFFSVADMVEDGDDDYLARLGLDPDGALYKMYNTLNSATSGAEKKTRRYEDNSDLQALIDGSSLSGDARTQYLFDNVNMSEAANYLAAMVIASDGDCCHKNYYVYRDSNGTGQWQILPWDLDLTFGHNWTPDVNYFNETVFVNNSVFVGYGNTLMTALFDTPAFRQMYLRRLRTLMDEQRQPPGTPAADGKLEQRMNQLLAQIGPDAALDYATWQNWGVPNTMTQAVASLENNYLVGRRNFLYNQQTVGNGGEIPLAQPNLAALPANQRNIVFGAIEYAPTSGNQDQEYIELANNNSFAVDISGWKLTEGVDFAFPGGTVIPANSKLYVTPDINAFRARTVGPRGGQGLFVEGGFSGHLSSFGETLRLVDASGVEIVSTSYLGSPTPAQQFLRVTEVMYNPTAPATGSPYSGGDFEYIELTNTGAQPLQLGGVRFTAGVDFTFGSITLPAGQRVLVVRNQAAFISRYGATFNIAGEFANASSLSGSGELIKLEDPLSGTIQEFTYSDSGAWPARADGRGASLQVIDTAGNYDDPANWRASSELGGSPGVVGLPALGGVVINEVLSHVGAGQSTSFELRNTTAAAIDIGGWYVADTASSPLEFQIPFGTILAAGGFVSFQQTQYAASGLLLDGAHGGNLYLVTAVAGQARRLVDEVHYDAAALGESLGRWPDGGALYPMSSPTLGAANSGPRVGPIVISELMTHPNGVNLLEFIELRNTTGVAVSLAGWKFDAGVTYTFGAGASLGPYATLVLTSFDPAAPINATALAGFRGNYGIGASVTLVGPFAGALDNSGETVRLVRPDTPPLGEPGFTPYVVVDEVSYKNTPPWPTGANGSGLSLTRSSQGVYGDQASNWTAAAPTPGSFAARVAGRHVFYNNSAFDGYSSAAGASDDGAVPGDKTALLPGQSASFANYTSYSRGLNGVMLEIENLAGAPTLADFEFRVGNSPDPTQWAIAPTPTLSLRYMLSGPARVSLVWPDGAIKNQWLQVKLKPGLGLAGGDVFYFGNAIAESGNFASDTQVNASDEIIARANLRTFLNPAPLEFPYDYNRDGFVNAADQIIARGNVAGFDRALKLFTAPSLSGLGLSAPSPPPAMPMLREENRIAAALANRGSSAVVTAPPSTSGSHDSPEEQIAAAIWSDWRDREWSITEREFANFSQAPSRSTPRDLPIHELLPLEIDWRRV